MMKHFTPLGTLFVLAALVGACGDDAPAKPKTRVTFKFPLHVTATDTADNPLPGAPVLIMFNGDEETSKTIGYTDKNGELKALVDAHHKTDVTVSIISPKDYEFVSGIDFVDDKLMVKIDEQDKTLVHANAITMNAKYRSKQIENLVWVKLNCPSKDGLTLCKNVEIKAGDEIVATTDIEGRAHFSLNDVPDKTVRLTIQNMVEVDDKEMMQLEPANPGFSLNLTTKPQLFAIEETFTEPEEEEEPAAKKKKPRRRKKAKRKTRRKKTTKKKKSSGGTLSFGTAKKKTKKKKKKKKSSRSGNGIDLF